MGKGSTGGVNIDWKDVPKNWHKNAEVVTPTSKQLMTIRLDTDVIDWFRQGGRGYQSRMNAVLCTFVRHKKGE